MTIAENATASTVYGGAAEAGTGSVNGNSVTVNGNANTSTVYGGWTKSGTGAVAGNSVTVTGNAAASKVYGGWSGSTASAVGNSVTYDSMAGGSGIDVFGGYSLSGNAGEDGSVTAGGATYTGGNTVKAAGNSTFQYIVGGASGGIGMSGNFGNADHNTVTFDGSDGAVSQLIYGGSSLRGDANNNTVSVSHVTKDTPLWILMAGISVYSKATTIE